LIKYIIYCKFYIECIVYLINAIRHITMLQLK